MKDSKKSTRQRILDEALTLFSIRGFERVTVAEIAEAVGIKAPSLYNHFKSKRDIFDAILDKMKLSYDRQTASMQMDGRDAEKNKSLYDGISVDNIIKMSTDLFLYFLHDDKERKFRKMLMIEQFNNENLADVYTKQYVDFPLEFQTDMYKMLISIGERIPEDPQIMRFNIMLPCISICACVTATRNGKRKQSRFFKGISSSLCACTAKKKEESKLLL